MMIGSLRSGGIAADRGLYIGAELRTRASDSPLDELNSWERANVDSMAELPCIVMHELMHSQQRQPADRTLLSLALYEGGAEFVAVRVCGRKKTALHEWGDRNERLIWRAFEQQMHGTSYGLWLFNGGRITDRPADLGYYVGYRIAEAYYERASDKRRALREILLLRDPRAFLRGSGYAARFMERPSRDRTGQSGRASPDDVSGTAARDAPTCGRGGFVRIVASGAASPPRSRAVGGTLRDPRPPLAQKCTASDGATTPA